LFLKWTYFFKNNNKNIWKKTSKPSKKNDRLQILKVEDTFVFTKRMSFFKSGNPILFSSKQRDPLILSKTNQAALSVGLPLYLERSDGWCIVFSITENKGVLHLLHPNTENVLHWPFENAMEWMETFVPSNAQMETCGNVYRITSG
jgi:hypothetical protein